ncbi:MAG: hypothetical protein RL092_862 [Bacteroidota bacterium]|jgi:hypothetical protein
MNDDSFFSVDRLLEFGMSMAIAQQMVNTMNMAMNNMNASGVTTPISSHPALYYAVLDGNPAGPFSEKELSQLITEKKILKDTYVWKPGMLQWQFAEKLPEVLKLVALTPPPFEPNI